MEHAAESRKVSGREAQARVDRNAYMKDYMRRRRTNSPKVALLDRARERSRRYKLPFDLTVDDIVIPNNCPALGIPIVIGGGRSAHSPSLDRIDPSAGYLASNTRVISSGANSLKGANGLADLEVLAQTAPRRRREAYGLLRDYVEREQLLKAVRTKAEGRSPTAAEWAKVAAFLNRAFQTFADRAHLRD
jgi:hypothetical protein